MLIPPEVLISAGTAAASTAFNAASQGNMNKKQRKWNEMMYNRQRYDNNQQWHMQNEYNSPANQMRLAREAGINPVAAFSGGNSFSPASVIKSADAPTWSPRAPEIDLAPAGQGGVNTYYDVQLKKAQVDNLKTQNSVLSNEAALKAAQILNTQTGTANTSLDVALKGGLFENSIAMAQENLRKLQSDSSLSLANARWAEPMNKQRFEQGEKTIQNLIADLRQKQSSTENTRMDTELKRYEAELRKNGITPSDPTYIRMLGQWLSDKFDLKNLKFK